MRLQTFTLIPFHVSVCSTEPGSQIRVLATALSLISVTESPLTSQSLRNLTQNNFFFFLEKTIYKFPFHLSQSLALKLSKSSIVF